MSVDSVAIFKKAIPGAKADLLTAVSDSLNKYAAQFALTTPKRIAAFMAQAAHETGGFNTLREYGNDDYFNRYEGRLDLGNNQKGDGLKFKGRGIFQTTGRLNYLSVSKKIFGDARLLDNPALLENPEYATLSALHYWNERNLNAYADNNDFIGLTKRINGGTNGLSDRNKYWLALTSMISYSPVAFVADFLKKKAFSTTGANVLSDIYFNIRHFITGNP